MDVFAQPQAAQGAASSPAKAPDTLASKTAPRRVLARKYRPKFLKDLIGQDLLVQSLSRGLAEQHLPQALLLHGIRGTGKTSTARILARAINCVGPDGQGGMTAEPCGVCKSCRALDEDRHPDVLEMDAASHTGVDDIRDIIDSAQYRAILGRYKVFIIDEVHMLSKSAFNALLKTLEEPPSHVLFVFATTEINKIPETILSRCARFDLKRVDSRTLMDHFESIARQEGYTIEKDALAVLARAADGSVRDGLTLLDQAMNLTDAAHQTTIASPTVQSMIGATDRRKLYVVLKRLLARQAEPLIEDVRALVEAGEDPVAILQDLLECLYRVACFRIMPRLAADDTIPEFERQAAEALAKTGDNLALLSLWKKLLKGYEDVKKAPFAQQALEMTLLRVCYAAGLPSLETWLKANPGSAPEPAMPVEKLLGEEPSQPMNPPVPSERPVCLPSSPSAHPTLSQASIPASSAPETSLTQTPIERLEDPHAPKAPASSRSITNLDELIAALEVEREALLLSYVRRDMAFVSIAPGRIVVQTKGKEAARALPLLKQFLHHYTGQKWTVDVDDGSATVLSLDEQRAAKRQESEAAFKTTPLMKAVQETFPGATVDFNYDGD